MKARTDYPDLEMHTELQWAKKGYVLLPEQEGRRLWSNRFHVQRYMYFEAEQVTPAITAEQKKKVEYLLEPCRQKKRESRRAYYEREKQEKIRQQELKEQRAKLDQGWMLCHEAEAELVEQPAKMIVLNTETTGLCISNELGMPDEILQISMVDENRKELFNSYIKPYAHSTWSEAQAVNGITPEMVKDAPYLHEVAPKIKGLLTGASCWIGYNIIDFDRPILEQAFGQFQNSPQVFDVMLQFAPIYGEWSEIYDGYKYKSLSVCAEYFGVQFHAHDSLEDAKVILSCFQKISERRRKLREGICRSTSNDHQREDLIR